MSGGGGLVAKSCLTLVTQWTVAHQARLSMGFSRQEYWSGLPFPAPGLLSNPGIEPRSPAVQADSLPTELSGRPLDWWHLEWFSISRKWTCYQNGGISSSFDFVSLGKCQRRAASTVHFPWALISLNCSAQGYPEATWVCALRLLCMGEWRQLLEAKSLCWLPRWASDHMSIFRN